MVSTTLSNPTIRRAPIDGDQVRLRPLTTSDARRLTEILQQPEVSEWWPRYDLPAVLDRLIHPDGSESLGVELGGRLVGIVHWSEPDDPEYRHASLHIALDPTCHGRGLGSDALRTVLRHLFTELGHHRVAMDPVKSNERAVRAYERVGFRRVGTMRRYRLDARGVWQDGVLLDLLREDFLDEPAD